MMVKLGVVVEVIFLQHVCIMFVSDTLFYIG